ncbi:monoglyceride lipase isoform X2 [Eurytemora carolleeae]|uniref:monoglyceride lipase isoform X2 n=1 Tax=Eurytemora carolleeae TaxID=1294199 RepID=UPI000C768EC9|nr:monoglyceride lipase isoform X2 [Eurytemora carolleeae]|eukprot:XP_023332037.1 monoglyceride lipase-like isoform X2 [Eurytemora affinis]
MESGLSRDNNNCLRDEVQLLTEEIESCSGLNLFARCWKPKAEHELKGLVFISHGFGEHLGWYDEHDHLGHGKSGGKRAYIERAEDYVNDILMHAAKVKNQYTGLSMFLYGHSMGGMLAVSTALRNQTFFKGLILEGPLITPDPAQATPLRIFLANLLVYFLPEMQLGHISVEQVTSDQEVQARILGDKYRWTGGFKLITSLAILRCLGEIRCKLNTISLPILILHGGNDSLCQPSGSHTLYQECTSMDKALKIYPRASHHLILEELPTRQAVFHEILSWLNKRTDSLEI